jgi:hypothetical protein
MPNGAALRNGVHTHVAMYAGSAADSIEAIGAGTAALYGPQITQTDSGRGGGHRLPQTHADEGRGRS